MYVDYFSRVSNSDEREGREKVKGRGRGRGRGAKITGGLGGLYGE